MLDAAFIGLFAAFVLCGVLSNQLLRRQSETIADLRQERDELRADNRALTESLVRSAGKPLVFGAPKTEQSEGWFEGRPMVVAVKKSE